MPWGIWGESALWQPPWEVVLLRGDLNLPPLPIYVQPGLKILFVGFNPGERSAQIGHYYGHPNNQFWRLLYKAGLTDRLLRPEDDHTMLSYGYGLTDIVARPTRSSGDLEPAEFRTGRDQLRQLLKDFRPRIACYNGKGVYAALTGKRKVEYGLQFVSTVPGVQDFVAASPSGRSREPLALKLELYKQLKGLVSQIE